MDTWKASEPGYETVRAAAVWQKATPSRYPAMIVRPDTIQEIVEAVTDPTVSDLPIAVKGSGHNFAGTQLRDDSLLVDLSALNAITVNGLRAHVGAGVRNAELCGALVGAGRMFPTGHHAGVGVSGYLLGGGMGWNGEFWGEFACFGVEAVDVILASGEVATIDEQNHPDLFWAARGSGPFFPAIATGFHVRTVALPRALMAVRAQFPLSQHEPVAAHLTAIGAERLEDIELMMLIQAGSPGEEPTCVVFALSHGSDAGTAEEVLRRVATGLPGASDLPVIPLSYAALYAESLTGDARRSAVDSAWCSDPEEATRMVAQRMADAPSPWSVAIINYRGDSALPVDAACSVTGQSYITWMAQWDEAADDDANLAWVANIADDLEPQTVGAYVNECDIIARPERAQRCFSTSAWARLQDVRAKYDPAGRFPGPQTVASNPWTASVD